MKLLIAGLLCCAFMLNGAELSKYKNAKNSWTDALIEAIAKERTVHIASGTYKIDKSLEITKDVALILSDGATLKTDIDRLFILKKGKLLIEGRGIPAEIHSSAVGDYRTATLKRAAIIDLTQVTPEASPSLEVKNVKFYGSRAVDGVINPPIAGKIESIVLENCKFFTTSYGIGIRCAEIGSARIENCIFEGVYYPIALSSPIHGGVIVRGNVLRRFGLAGIQVGKGGQISEGCTTHLSSAIIHDNQLLTGGLGTNEKHSYIHGILVYGHNVSVQGNVVRDVNRGETIPGKDYGRQFRTKDGKLLTHNWIFENGKRRRLAGAAIYLKANKAVVQGNVCTNSGWRSVIEIKTGGKEHFVSVVNNIVDGSALNTDDSFGFECNSGRSLWANNMVFNMPHQAFVVRSGYENTFINNVIVNTQVGFALSGNAPGYQELISGNRFINVTKPIVVDGKSTEGLAPDVLTLPPARLAENQELPEPGPEVAGRIFIKGTKFFYCVKLGSEYVYMELAGKVIPNKKYKVIGKELLFNADQSGKEKSDNELLNNPLHPGWAAWLRSAREQKLEAKGNITFDTENFKTGGRSLKICMVVAPGSWQLRQNVNLKPGARYRATAVVKGEEPLNLRLEVRPKTGRSFIKRAADVRDWQTVSLDFTNPADSSQVVFLVWSSKTNMHKNAWLDSVSLKEIADEESVAKAEAAAARKTVGPELAGSKWSAAKFVEVTKGKDTISFKRVSGKSNIVINQKVRLTPGKTYRAVMKVSSNIPAKRFSVNGKFDDSRQTIPAVAHKGDIITLQGDLTVPENCKTATINLWINQFNVNEYIKIHEFSLKELE